MRSGLRVRLLCPEWGWTRACCVTWRGSWCERRCPLLLCAWGLTRRGVWSEGKCGKVPCWSLCGSWPSWVPPQTVATKQCLFLMVRASMCVWFGLRGDVLTLSIRQHLFYFHDRTVKTHGWRSPEEERTGVRHGSFSGKAIFSVDSQIAFLKCPSLNSLIVSDSEVSCLTPVYAHSPGAFPQGLASPLRSCLPMTRWPGPCEEVPLGAVLGRASHPWVGDRASCYWAAWVASGPCGCGVCSLSIRVKKL